jgi:hypothetical protein
VNHNMLKPKLALVAVFSFGLGAAAQSPLPGPGEDLAKGLRKNVVRVNNRGFGIIVGQKGDRLYIVTPNHVVPDGKREAIDLSFFSRPGERVAATLLLDNARYPNRDLAVLEAPLPANFSWERNCEADIHKLIAMTGTDDLRGIRAWFIGRQADSKNIWFVPSNPGLVNGGPNTEELIAVEIATAMGGTSGAPLVTDAGIIGMIVQDEGAGVVRALSFGFIKRLFRERQLEWSLKPTAGSASIPRISGVTAGVFPSPPRGELTGLVSVGGVGFGSSGAKIFLNDRDVSQHITTLNDSSIVLRGLPKQLNLVSGQNRIYIMVGSNRSNTYEFTQRF